MRHKGLLKSIERLLSELVEPDCQIVLDDGSTVKFSFQQLDKGCVDSIGGIESYESFVCEHAVSGSGESGLTLSLLAAITHPKKEGL